jgi:hypothetical protein
MENIKLVEVKSKPDLYPTKEQNPNVGELAGKPTGDIKHEIIVNGKSKGKIFETKEGRFQATSESVFGKYKAKFYKTFEGAKNAIIKGKERFVSLSDVDLMTGERKINGKTRSQLKAEWDKTKEEKF